MAFQQHNRIKVGKAIHERKPFVHASMSGKWMSSYDFTWNSYGKLPQEDVSILRELLKDRDLYIVYSYRTPIAYAWDRTMHVFDNTYSVTTNQHQSIVKLADHYALNY